MTYLAENIFPIDANDLPNETAADSRGELLLFSPKSGWIISHYTDVEEITRENECTYWTFLPENP